MSETFAEQISRLELMADGDPQWDLSDNDRAAIRALLENYRVVPPRRAMEYSWTLETMDLINRLTPEIKGKAFDPEWFLLRKRFEQIEEEVWQAKQSTSATQPIVQTQADIT